MSTIGNVVIEPHVIMVSRDDPQQESRAFWRGEKPVLPFKRLAGVFNEDGKPTLYVHTDVAAEHGIAIVMHDGRTEAKRLDYHIIETCPHCGFEVHLDWSPRDDGFEIYCPKCGERIMLCDACSHPDEYDVTPDQQHPPGSCDWCKESGCWRKKQSEKSVVIKGMQIPKDGCAGCRLESSGICMGFPPEQRRSSWGEKPPKGERRKNCPLGEERG